MGGVNARRVFASPGIILTIAYAIMVYILLGALLIEAHNIV
jgi:hypothetical protein